DMLIDKQIRAELDSGGEVVLAVEPAHAMQGLGLWYELRTTSVFITRLLQGSPADRAGIKGGDEVVQIGGKDVKAMTSDEVRSNFNAVPPDGLALGIRHEGGARLNVTLKEGPIYPTYEQFRDVE